MPATTAHKARELTVADIPMDRPIVTLDIDGVLNAFAARREGFSRRLLLDDDPTHYELSHSQRVVIPSEMRRLHGYRPGTSFRITWSDELMADIRILSESGDATVVWLTSWNAFADFLGWRCFWGDGPSPALGFLDSTTGMRRSSYAGKFVVLEELCKAMEVAHPDGDILPVIAIDDDAPWEERLWLSLDRTGEMDDPWPGCFHGIMTNPRYGITRTEWQEILALVRGGQATADGQATDGLPD